MRLLRVTNPVIKSMKKPLNYSSGANIHVMLRGGGVGKTSTIFNLALLED